MRRPSRLFAFRLAALFGCPVGELMARLTIGEFREWMAYDQIEPFGEGRMVLQAAMAMRQQMPKDSEFEFNRLIPFYREPPREPIKEPTATEQADMETRMKAFFIARAKKAA